MHRFRLKTLSISLGPVLSGLILLLAPGSPAAEAGHVSGKPGRPGEPEPETLLPAPRWQVGDWFTIKVSTWNGHCLPRSPEEVEWDREVKYTYTVTSEIQHFGHPCFVLEESSPNQQKGAIRRKYLFRQSDLSCIEIQVPNDFPSKNFPVKVEIGTSPWILTNLCVAPRFPVDDGKHDLKELPLLDAAGKPAVCGPGVNHRMEIPILIECAQEAARERWSTGLASCNVVRLESSYHENYQFTSRWVPGQLWWAQCWQNPRWDGWYYRNRAAKTGKVDGEYVSTYRAALHATSRDGVLDYPLPRAGTCGKLLEK